MMDTKINKLKSLANQAFGDSGIMIAVAWLIAEINRINDWSFAIVAVILAFAAATKSIGPGIGWAFVSSIVALSVTVKLGLIP